MRALLGSVGLALVGACGGGGTQRPGNDAATGKDAAADAAPDAPPQDRCPGVTVRRDGALDLDVRSLAVAGRVTMAGAALPDEHRLLQFMDTRTGAAAEVAIAADGTYATTLRPSVYDVRWRGGESCALRKTPCIDGTLRAQLALTTAGVLDLDIPRVQVTGRVRQDGAALPSTARGTLRFSSGNAVAQVVIDAAAASYAVVLLPGRYDIGFDAADCAGPAPCNAGVLRSQVDVTASGVLDLDLASVHVSGKLTVNGQHWTAGTGAAVELRRAGESRAGVLPVRADGSYDGVVAPGRYEVRFRGDASTCGVHAAAAPCNAGVLRSDLALTASGVLDLDVPMVAISGALSLAGAGFPATVHRGSLSFALAGDPTALAIAGSGERPRYEIALLAGRYQIGFVADSAGCAPPVPCNAGTLRRDVAATSDGVLDLDVPTVRVAGVVTANGAALPALGGVLRGGVRFVGADAGSSASVPLAATGPASYVVALLPGPYDVRFEGSPALCLAATATAVPCNQGTLKTAVSLMADGVLDLDLETARVIGKVSLNGGAMPVQPSSAATIAWQLAGEAPLRVRPFADAGTASYAVTILRGQYVVHYAADPSACGGPSATPCLDQPLAGCP